MSVDNTPKKRSLLWVIAIPVLMFGFGFALVPIYDVFCQVTGLNGKVNTQPETISQQLPVTGREVKIQFVTYNNSDMPWDFSPLESNSMEVHPGTDNKAMFRVTNTTDSFMRGKAVPSVTPAEAAQYFHKVQCFCFDQQELEAGESLDMPVVFVVDSELPEHIHTITLAYTLFDITMMAAK